MNARSNTPLRIPEGRSGDWSVVHQTKPANTPINLVNMRCQIFGGQRTRTISWPFETTWHFLKEGRGTWMSDLPCEQQQHVDCLKGEDHGPA